MKNTKTTFQADKLSRDNDPDNMVLDNMVPVLKANLSNDQLLAYFKAKLIEESHEVMDATDKAELLDEMCDCLDVIDGLAKQLGYNLEDVHAASRKKRAKRGGFEKGVVIETITMPNDHPRIDRFQSRPEKYPVVEKA